MSSRPDELASGVQGQASPGQRVIAEKTLCVLLVSGENEEGSPIYAYVGVTRDRLDEFIAAQESGTCYPEDFGRIIESGEGEPPEDVRLKMEIGYAFDHEALMGIPNAEAANEIVGNFPSPSPSPQVDADRADFDAAIARALEIINATVAHGQRAPRLSSLADALRWRFEMTRDVVDLNHAVGLYERALDDTAEDAPQHEVYGAILSENRSARAEHTAETDSGVRSRTGTLTERLTLRTAQFVDDDTWTWQLLAGDNVVATTEVSLDEGWQREAFNDLSGYLSRYSTPEFASDHLREVLADLGSWVSARVLGPELVAHIASRLPASVTVELEPRQQRLLAAPLELAQVDDAGSLASCGAVFSFAVGGEQMRTPTTHTRIMTILPLPTGVPELGLRAEREALRSIAEQATAAGEPVTITFLQYSATRTVLQRLLTDETWDVVHVGGHGRYTGLLLTSDSGGQDFVTADELLHMLKPQIGKLRLVFLGACDTGANQAARLIGNLHSPNEPWRDATPDRGHLIAEGGTRGLALRIAQEIHAVVVAMRFAVDDKFASVYTTSFYDGLLLRGVPVDEACACALAESTRRVSCDALGALAMFTPVLYCPRSTNLRLTAGAGDVTTNAQAPPQPAAPFSGRVAVLRRMATLLHPGRTAQAVLLAGSCGIGKSACAEEFAAISEGVFERVICVAVGDNETHESVAARLREKICLDPGAWVGIVETGAEQDWSAAAKILRSRRLLVIIDGLDAAATGEGRPASGWQCAVKTLLDDATASKVIFTSRNRPAFLEQATRCATITLDGLSYDETWQLMAQLPRLGRLLRAWRAATSAQGYFTLQMLLTHSTSAGHPGLLVALDAVSVDLPRLREAIDELDVLAESGPDTTHRGTGWDLAVDAFSWIATTLSALPPDHFVLAELFAAIHSIAGHTLSDLRLCWPAWREALGHEDDPQLQPLIARLVGEGVLIAQADPADAAVRYHLAPLFEQSLAPLRRFPDARNRVMRILHGHRATKRNAALTEAATTDTDVGGDTFQSWLAAAREIFLAGRQEEALRLLVAVVEFESSSAGKAAARSLASTLADQSSATRVKVLDGLAGNLSWTTGRRDLTAHSLQRAYEEALSEPDLAITIGLSHLGFLVDSYQLDAFDELASRVWSLVASTGHVEQLALERLRYERMRATLRRGQYREALAEARVIIAAHPVQSPMSPNSAHDPVYRFTTSRLVEGAILAAAYAFISLEDFDAALDYADRLAEMRATRRAPFAEVAEGLMVKVYAFAGLDRLDEARELLDVVHGMSADAEDADSVFAAVTARMRLDLAEGKLASATSMHQEVLLTAYQGGSVPVAGFAHAALSSAFAVRYLELASDSSDPAARDAFYQARIHMLAYVALTGLESLAAAMLDLPKFLWLLEDRYHSGESLEAFDFVWIDRQLNSCSEGSLPFLELLKGATGTPERFAAHEADYFASLRLTGLASGSKEGAAASFLDALLDMRVVLEPTFATIAAATAGSAAAHREIASICVEWEQRDETGVWAAATHALVEHLEPDELTGGVELEVELYREALAISYSTGAPGPHVGEIHLGLCFAAARSYESASAAADESVRAKKMAVRTLACARVHLLAGVAICGLISPGMMSELLRRLGWLLDALYAQGESPESLDFEWIDAQLDQERTGRLPFAELIRRMTSTPERLAAHEARYTETLRTAQHEDTRGRVYLERCNQIAAAVASIVPKIGAAAVGDAGARRELEDISERWGDIDGRAPYAVAIHTLDSDDAISEAPFAIEYTVYCAALYACYGEHVDASVTAEVHLACLSALLRTFVACTTNNDELSDDDGQTLEWLMTLSLSHLLAGIAFLSVDDAGLAAITMKELADSFALIADEQRLEDLDFVWIDETLNREADERLLPFLDVVAAANETPERLAEHGVRFQEILHAAHRADKDREEQDLETEAQIREVLEPTFATITAAADGDSEARRELDEFCAQWEKTDGRRQWAVAFQMLAERRDASELAKHVDAEALLILMPLMKELGILGGPA